MKRQWLAFMLAVVIITSAVSVYAAEEKQQATVFTVTPRLWYAYADLADAAWYDIDTIRIPMYGLSIAVSTPKTPNWSVLINGLYGTADGSITTTSPNQPHYLGTADYERLDLELLLRYTFPGTGISLFIGPRYVNWQQKQVVPNWYNWTNKVKADIFTPQVGVSFVSDIGELGKHRFFGNLAVGISYLSGKQTWSAKVGPITLTGSDTDSGTQPCLDGNIGYEYFFFKANSVSLRYRLFIHREDTRPGTKYATYHGPEFGLSFRF